jgi:hypothetical protein
VEAKTLAMVRGGLLIFSLLLLISNKVQDSAFVKAFASLANWPARATGSSHIRFLFCIQVIALGPIQSAHQIGKTK